MSSNTIRPGTRTLPRRWRSGRSDNPRRNSLPFGCTRQARKPPRGTSVQTLSRYVHVCLRWAPSHLRHGQGLSPRPSGRCPTANPNPGRSPTRTKRGRSAHQPAPDRCVGESCARDTQLSIPSIHLSSPSSFSTAPFTVCPHARVIAREQARARWVALLWTWNRTWTRIT